jgi:hypothetical protein
MSEIIDRADGSLDMNGLEVGLLEGDSVNVGGSDGCFIGGFALGRGG